MQLVIKEITDYCVQIISTPTDLIELNNLIKDGWQPWGSPFLDDRGCASQALVKQITVEYRIF